MEGAVSVKNLSVKCGGTIILDSITADFDGGSVTAVIGRNGAGKTTLLRQIAGLRAQNEFLVTGSVVFRSTSSAAQGDVLAPRVGMLFQKPYLFPWATVRENIGLHQKLTGTSVTDAFITELLDLVGLAGYGDKYPSQLSGGMQHRVALARECAAIPDILLLDEPFSSLDRITRVDLQRDMLSIWRSQQSTIIFVTHDPYDAIAVADRLLVLGHGQITAERLLPKGSTSLSGDPQSEAYPSAELISWIDENLRL